MLDFKKHIPEYVFIIFLYLIFFLEGFSLKEGRVISYYLILFFPLIFLFIFFLYKKQIFLNKNIISTGFLFLICILISIFNSVDVQKSFEGFVLLLSFFVIYILVLNLNQEILSKKIIILIKTLGFIMVFVSFIFNKITDFNWINIFDKTLAYQYIFSPFGQHFHFGNFLVFPLIYYFFIYQKTDSKNYFFLFFSSVILTIFSFSRSAYISFLIVFIILLFKNRNIKKKLTIFFIPIIVLIFIFFFIFSTVNLNFIPIVNNFQLSFSKKINFNNSFSFGQRDVYINQGIESFYEKPFFGTGIDNFFWASNKFSFYNNEIVLDGHNIILTTLVEVGFFGLIFLILLISYLYKNFNGSMWTFLVIGGFINFQLDYTYKIYSYLILFLVFISLSQKKQENILNILNLFYISIFIFVSGLILFISNFIYSNNLDYVNKIYPLNKESNVFILSKYQEKKDYLGMLKIIEKISFLYKGDPYVLENIGDIFNNFGNKQMAIIFYKKSLNNLPNYNSFSLLKKIYFIDNKIFTKDKNLNESFNKLIHYYSDICLRKIRRENVYSKDEFRNLKYSLRSFCEIVTNNNCGYELTYCL